MRLKSAGLNSSCLAEQHIYNASGTEVCLNSLMQHAVLQLASICIAAYSPAARCYLSFAKMQGSNPALLLTARWTVLPLPKHSAAEMVTGSVQLSASCCTLTAHRRPSHVHLFAHLLF